MAFAPEQAMRKWYIPVTMLGVGGVGAFLFSERGRQAVHMLRESFRRAPDALLKEWNEAAQIELDRIQAALNRIAESLEPRGQLGH